MMLSIAEMAQRLAEADGAYSARYFVRQLRHFVYRGVLQPAGFRGEGRTAAAVFDERGLCEARLVTVLAALGLAIEDLAAARRCMSNIDDETRAVLWQRYAGRHSLTIDGLRHAMDGARAGECWYFVIRAGAPSLDSDGSRSTVLGGSFTVRTDIEHPMEPIHRAAIVLPCLPLLRPLLIDRQEEELCPE